MWSRDALLRLTTLSNDAINLLARICLLTFAWAKPVISLEDVSCDVAVWLLSVNIAFSFYKLTRLLQMVGGIGQNIVAVISSLVSGRMPQMLLISTIVLLMFVAVFNVLIRDETTEFNFLYLYRGLIFGDGDGLDFMGMKTDYQDDGMPEPIETLFHAQTKSFIMTFATIIFNIVLLNLVIAVYGNEYDAKVELSEAFFTRLRAAYCSRTLMLCSSVEGISSYSTLIAQKTGILHCGYSLSAVLFILGIAHIFMTGDISYTAAISVCCSLLILREKVMDAQSSWFDEDSIQKEKLYLWIAYPTDYEKDRFLTKDDKEDKAKEDLTQLEGKIDNLQEALAQDGSPELNLKHLNTRVDNLDKHMEKVLQAMNLLRKMNVAPRRPSTAD